MSDDLISRQAAIDAIESKYGIFIITPDIISTLESIDHAEPKRGEWILDRSGAYCCSECMEPCATYIMMKPRDKFCKMCGSKMEVTT